MGSALDLTGQKFNYLTAIEKTDKRKNGLIVWKFKCECGNTIEVPASYVKNGNTKSCGCKKYSGLQNYNENNSQKAIIEKGSVFGKLIVIEDIGLKPQYNGAKKNRRWYKCQCECGKITEASGNQLKNGMKISCGCICSKGEEIIRKILKENNINFDTDSQFKEMTEQTGKKLRFDFIIYNDDGTINRFCEFDGQQHNIGFSGGKWSHAETYEVIHERDILKNKFCLENGYKLVRIPYNKLKSLCLEDIMSDKYVMKGDDL